MSETERFSITANSAPSCVASFNELTDVATVFADGVNITATLKSLVHCSIETGGYVQLLPEMSYIPVLVGNDNEPVFLYQLIEIIEGYLDFDGILVEFPTLNFSQVVGAISFLRKIAQINSRQIDVDALEDDQDSESLQELRSAFADRENIKDVFTDAY